MPCLSVVVLSVNNLQVTAYSYCEGFRRAEMYDWQEVLRAA